MYVIMYSLSYQSWGITIHIMLSTYEVLWAFHNLVIEDKEWEDNSKLLIKNNLKIKTNKNSHPTNTHFLNFEWIITKTSFSLNIYLSSLFISSSQCLCRLLCLNFTNWNVIDLNRFLAGFGSFFLCSSWCS